MKKIINQKKKKKKKDLTYLDFRRIETEYYKCVGWWFGLVWFLSYINHCILFNNNSSLNIYITYIWFGLVDFYGISTMVGYLKPNPLYTNILNIDDLVWFSGISGFVGYLMLNQFL